MLQSQRGSYQNLSGFNLKYFPVDFSKCNYSCALNKQSMKLQNNLLTINVKKPNTQTSLQKLATCPVHCIDAKVA